MKKIVYLGYVVNPLEADRMSGASVAGNKMQWNIVKNLSKHEDIELTCITIVPLAAYPRDKKIHYKYNEVILLDGVCSIRVGFINLPIIKQFWQTFSMYYSAKKIVKEKEADVLLTFNVFPQIGLPMRWLKKKYPNLETVSILADLPLDDKKDRKGFSSILRAFFDKSTWKNMKECEKVIVLNEYVIEKYLPGKTYIVVDGGVSDEDIEHNIYVDSTKEKEKNILFCGALTEYNGILNLIQAMNNLKDLDVFLDIYGYGYLEKQVEDAAKTNCRIRYHGKVSNEEVMKRQQEAWLLINPRDADDLISKVTFPSKTFEYFLSGTPVVSTRLNGYGDDYCGKMIFAESSSPQDIEVAIRNAYQMGEDIQKIADSAKKFVIEERNWEKQANRIMEFL